MSERKTVIFYGNCQAGAAYQVFAADPAFAERFRLVYLPSFDDPQAAHSDATPADAAQAAALFEQFDPNPFPLRDRLPADCLRVTFPAVDFNLLWPLTCTNPYNDPSPDLPWGHFPYGDRLVVDCIKRGLSADATWQRYQESSQSALPDLHRFAQLERSRLVAREAKCDLAFSDYIFDRYASENLFWCVNHPTLAPLAEMAGQLADRAAALGRLDIETAVGRMNPRGPLALINVPIHPHVAEALQLAWYPGEGPHYGLGDATLTYEEYFRQMIARSIEIRDVQALAQPG